LRVAAFSAGGGGSFALAHSSMTVCAVAFVTQMPATIAAASVMADLFRRLFTFPPVAGYLKSEASATGVNAPWTENRNDIVIMAC
jgi:hypothetical protein